MTEQQITDAELDAMLVAALHALTGDDTIADRHLTYHVHGSQLDPVSGCPACLLGVTSRTELEELLAADAAVDEELGEAFARPISTQVVAIPATFTDPDAVRALARVLSTQVVDRVRGMFDEAHARRRDGRVTAEILAPELQLVGDLADALSAVSKAIDSGAVEARGIAGELMHELHPELERGGSRSTRVGAAGGTDLKVTTTQPTRLSVRADEIVDVLAAALIAEATPGLKAAAHAKPYADGVRDGIAALRAVLTTSDTAWRSSELDKLARNLEAREEYELAIRLGHAYGRASTGKARTTIERVTTTEEGKA